MIVPMCTMGIVLESLLSCSYRSRSQQLTLAVSIAAIPEITITDSQESTSPSHLDLRTSTSKAVNQLHDATTTRSRLVMCTDPLAASSQPRILACPGASQSHLSCIFLKPLPTTDQVIVRKRRVAESFFLK